MGVLITTANIIVTQEGLSEADRLRNRSWSICVERERENKGKRAQFLFLHSRK